MAAFITMKDSTNQGSRQRIRFRYFILISLAVYADGRESLVISAPLLVFLVFVATVVTVVFLPLLSTAHRSV